ncbi:hypothetical protein [Aquabacterium sp.]|uniref:hypothetical protein n=1 Tax=Aquabacterium sp. TaxID=1872578 RepID=UPI0025C0804B|nr:hypothetical protein [Aquabacterium sp.]
MRDIYEIGRVYIWQNQTGEMAFLNGTECTVVGHMEYFKILNRDDWEWGQETDSFDHESDFMAQAGDLRPKDPPPGEKSISDLFKLPQLEPEHA